MKKVPNILPRELLEVKRKHEMGVKYARIKTDYNISYNDIKKIIRFFSNCEFESDINSVIEKINADNDKCSFIDHKANYQRYKQYYKEYSKRQYQLRKSS